MSYRSRQYSQYPQHHPHDHGRPSAQRAQLATAAPVRRAQDGYTVVHAGKQRVLGPGVPSPSPISDTVIFVAPPDREARLQSGAPLVSTPRSNQFAKIQGVDSVLVGLPTSLDKVESRQMASLNAVEDSMESRVRRMRG